MSKVLFQITPLRCHGCGKEIEDKLLEHRGVLWAKVFPKIGRIRTEFDESETSADHLEGLICSWGYVVKRKELMEGNAK